MRSIQQTKKKKEIKKHSKRKEQQNSNFKNKVNKLRYRRQKTEKGLKISKLRIFLSSKVGNRKLKLIIYHRINLNLNCI